MRTPPGGLTWRGCHWPAGVHILIHARPEEAVLALRAGRWFMAV